MQCRSEWVVTVIHGGIFTLLLFMDSFHQRADHSNALVLVPTTVVDGFWFKTALLNAAMAHEFWTFYLHHPWVKAKTRISLRSLSGKFEQGE